MKTVFRGELILLLLAGLIGCGSHSAEQHFGLAEEARRAGNTVGALEHYRAVVDQYPSSPLAEISQFSVASILQNDMHDFPAAISAYERYLGLYPDSMNAPSALFLVGYIFHNELGNLDSASAAYTMFLEKYPDHEMATSARYELANLGKAPEELLPGPSSANQSSPSPPSRTAVTQSRSR
ncbi:MAG: tetratricopeptide repeat protein [Ignavibacteria bacterium]|nr:tetratricopeptide repeat protein [Ignavibacteria bacterium]